MKKEFVMGENSYDTTALNNGSVFCEVIKYAQATGRIPNSVDANAPIEDVVNAFKPGQTREENNGRTIVYDFGVGRQKSGMHAEYIANACGNIDENQGFIRYQNKAPLTGGSAVLKFTFDNEKKVIDAETFMESRF